ncbi:MAG: hypothetical protein SGI73_04475 [Chloroflexota bacterium]|nr:hypothetical protein [Chloroflexota bacterium]
MTTSISEARAAKEVVKRLLAGVMGVAGIGISWDNNGAPVVLVNVEKEAAARIKLRLSKHTLDVPVEFEEIGTITFESEK